MLKPLLFVVPLLVLLSDFSYGQNAQTLDEARAQALENVVIAEMILADRGNYPGANLSNLSTFVYYIRNVPTSWNNIQVLNALNQVYSDAIRNVKLPLKVPVDVPSLDWDSMINLVLARVWQALVCILGFAFSVWGCLWIYRKFRSIASDNTGEFERS